LKKIGFVLFVILIVAGLIVMTGMASEKKVKSKKDDKVVYVYGPGGPLGPMEELGKENGLIMQKRMGILFTAALPTCYATFYFHIRDY
jgi:hypothetical protein